ncbi:MAG: hypothetical protein SX243_06580 [Acidobacteriota bacterium]|nr:hypothetical protein [Acidobacteriota bacterium]
MGCILGAAWHHDDMIPPPAKSLRLAVIIFLVLAAVVLTATASARPAISWEPESVFLPVVRGESTSISASFTANTNLGQVELRVVPELAEFVSVIPSSPLTINRGTTTQVELTVQAGTDSILGVLEGTVQVRKLGHKPKNYSRPLPINIEIQPFPLPPAPGEAGKVTVEGVDSDGDGLRDDIQRFIAFTYPDEPVTRAALSQYGESFQDTLVQAVDRQSAFSLFMATLRSDRCLKGLIGVEEGETLRKSIKAQYLNTAERSDAFFTFAELLGGSSWGGAAFSPEDDCDFNPGQLIGGHE